MTNRSFPTAPGALDYGVIAVGSVVEKRVTLKNNLNQYVCFTFKVWSLNPHEIFPESSDAKMLPQLAGSGVQCALFPSSPSHLILPPLSFTHLPLSLQRDSTGVLERWLYNVPDHSLQHIFFHGSSLTRNSLYYLPANWLTFNTETKWAANTCINLVVLFSIKCIILSLSGEMLCIICRCVECLVNAQHVVRLPVHVEAVPLSLSLSTNTLTLSQPPTAPPSAGRICTCT